MSYLGEMRVFPVPTRTRPSAHVRQNNTSQVRIKVEIAPEKLLELIRNRVLSASDLRCLDYKSKNALRELCLWACLE
ncbi:MAG: hypothetical protein CL395_05375 [Acidiferrobacteraceae bacterium]|jgi:hypothetical protein|nr:hypothetical protein [Acidiferrobacteraceae bacterium]